MGYNPWYLAEIGKFCNPLKMNNDVIPFETPHCKLSENQKIVEFGSTEFKLWQLKECPKPMWQDRAEYNQAASLLPALIIKLLFVWFDHRSGLQKLQMPTVFHVVIAGYWDKFSTSNNHTSVKPHWLWYCHCAKLTLYDQLPPFIHKYVYNNLW